MAKFELPIIDFAKDEVKKTYERNFLPTEIYIESREISERAEDMREIELLEELCKLFERLFPELTEDEFWNNTDPAYILALYRDILTKSTKIVSPKNA